MFEKDVDLRHIGGCYIGERGRKEVRMLLRGTEGCAGDEQCTFLLHFSFSVLKHVHIYSG